MKCVYMLGQGNERAGFKWFALIVAILFILFTTFAYIMIKEKSTVDVDSPGIYCIWNADRAYYGISCEYS